MFLCPVNITETILGDRIYFRSEVRHIPNGCEYGSSYLAIGPCVMYTDVFQFSVKTSIILELAFDNYFFRSHLVKSHVDFFFLGGGN